jgi:NADP-dependent 3-hydroxy acid dehydrogenase YdfG
MSNNIEGKVVVITGASSGVGEATRGFSQRRVRTLS